MADLSLLMPGADDAYRRSRDRLRAAEIDFARSHRGGGCIAPRVVAGAGRPRLQLHRKRQLRPLIGAVCRTKAVLDCLPQSSGSSSGPTACTSSSEAGRRATLDLIVGAHGLHSRARELVFGPQARFEGSGGEDTKRNLSTLRAAARPAFGCRFRDRQVGMPRSARRFDFMTHDRLGRRFRALALDDIEDGILAQPEPVADFAVRLSFADEL